MIGVFDSGIGGLTVLRVLVARFPGVSWLYLADHAHAPYGNRSAIEVVELTRSGVETLFSRGCKLVVLGCNTATAVAARTLQQEWLPASGWSGHNVLGIVAPTVEAATHTPWAVTTPVYPQKNNDDLIAVFGTTRTVASGVYVDEIRKRCPKVDVVQQALPGLAGAIEAQSPVSHLDDLVRDGVEGLLKQTNGVPPHRAILGCTHYPLVEASFRRHLPAVTRLLSQPSIVADSLEDYLERRPRYLMPGESGGATLLTTGNPLAADVSARVFWPDAPSFRSVAE